MTKRIQNAAGEWVNATQEQLDYYVAGVGRHTAEKKRARLKLAVTALRFDKETGGVVVGGMSIKTDRESQAQLSNAYTSLSAGLIVDAPWKGVNGWATVTLLEIAPIAQAVALHVRGCFLNEKGHHDAIDNAADEALDSYDITTGWPV